MRRELRVRQGANIASRRKEMYGEKFSRRPKKRDQRFLAVFFLSKMDLGDVDTWKM